MIKIGVIADDFTGATDIASFLVENGLPTVQINGVPTGKMPEAIDALVISLKLSPMMLPARRISPVLWWKTVYQRYKVTVFQQVKCRKQSTHW